MSQNDFKIQLPDGAWGVHMSLDLKKCNDNVKIRHMLVAWADDLVRSIQMDQHGPTQTEHFGKDDKAGWTVAGLLTTSNYCAHFCDESRDGYIDVFSCKNIDPQAVLDCVYRWFKPEKVVHSLGIRGQWQ